MIDELSCILYVNYDKDDLAEIVAQLLGVTTNSRDIEHKLVLAYVARNKNIYSREKFRSGSDFLFYPQYIELEPTEIAEDRYVFLQEKHDNRGSKFYFVFDR